MSTDTSASTTTVAPETPEEGERARFIQHEVEELIAYFDIRPMDATDAVLVMAIVQTRVCAALGETRDASFERLQEMLSGLFEASKNDFDSKPTEPPAPESPTV